jgi:hypothetical protein
MRIQYLADKHVYIVGGRLVPSVTQIQRDNGIYDQGSAEWWTPAGRMKGQLVHELCAGIDQGRTNPDELPLDHWEPMIGKKGLEAVHGCTAAWRKFVTETEYKAVHVEKVVYHPPPWEFAGRLDTAGTWKFSARPVVIDRKVGGVHQSHHVQLAAYAMCLQPQHDRCVVLLKPGGDYTLHQCRGLEDRRIFLQAVSLYQWRKRWIGGERI